MIIRPTCRLQEIREQVGALRDGMVGEDEIRATLAEQRGLSCFAYLAIKDR